MLNMKEYRKKRGLTQKQLAKLIGCSEIAISQYERGLREPSIDRLVMILSTLDLTFEELIDYRAVQERVMSKMFKNIK